MKKKWRKAKGELKHLPQPIVAYSMRQLVEGAKAWETFVDEAGRNCPRWYDQSGNGNDLIIVGGPEKGIPK